MPRNGTLARIILALGAAALVGALAAGAASAAHKGHEKRLAGTLTGAGSSLVGPAFSIWAPAYKSAKGVTVNYSSVGSGAGIAQISARTVDFGASDAPFTPAQAAGCTKNGVGCINIPWALAATGPVVNIPNVATGQLRLTGPVLANIYLGKITSWNDPAITKLNPGLNLPNLRIHVVYRSDGSGDTYAFTNYLSKVSKTWSSKVGYATTVNWPTGTGGLHNDGVAAVVGSTPGSIGYVSTAYVIANHLRMVKMRNANGHYTAPTVKSIELAAELVNAKKIPKNFTGGLSIVDPPKSKKYKNAWPISTFTYVLLPTKTSNAASVKAFIKWVLQPAQQKSIQKLVFAPMPSVVVKAAVKTLNKIHS
jgi:phosphate transport system substrate-binding protein